MRRLTLPLGALILLALACVASTLGPVPGGDASIPGVASIYATSTGTGNDYSTYLLLDCEDDISDRSAYQRGDPDSETATVSSAQKKWGSESCAFSGAQSVAWANEPLWHMTGDFTWDAWVRFAALPTDGNYMVFFSWRDAGYNNSTNFALQRTDAGGIHYYLRYWALNGGADVVGFTREVTVAVDTWYHVAVTRSGDDYRVFLDGTQAGATENNASAIADTDAPFTLGRLYTGDPTGSLNGYMDEIRLSMGVARWTANFSVPTAAYGHLALFITDDDGAIYPLVQPWGY